MAFDQERFEALVLYIAHRRRDDQKFGRTKLAKTLFYSDFDAYRDEGKSLTGASYIRMPFGPFPSELDETEQSLQQRGLVKLDHVKGDYEEKRIIPATDSAAPPLEVLFEGWQVVVVNNWTDRIGSATARQISDYSHGHPGWRIASETGARIPYETAVLPQERPNAAEAERAKEIAREHGWLSPDGEWVWERNG